MQSYLSGRGANIQDEDSEKTAESFSSYLTDPSKKHTIAPNSELTQKNEDLEKKLVHEDESGIKIEVVSADGIPTNLLVHIPDGRIIDLSCQY